MNRSNQGHSDDTQVFICRIFDRFWKMHTKLEVYPLPFRRKT